MKAVIARHKALFRDKTYVLSLLAGVILVIASLIINYYAALYAADRASNSVTDIILSNIPVFDVDWIFVYGPVVFWAVVTVLCLNHPRRMPFMLKSLALFVVVRSIFITLTHIGPYPDEISIDVIGAHFLNRFSSTGKFFLFSSGGDLFFSGHTGLPFLVALVFWNDKLIRYFCLVMSVVFGVVVLLGHLHYTIDVLSAFFITYTIYCMATWLFKKDHFRFLNPSP